MAVERVVAGVDDSARKPAAIEALIRIEYLVRRLDPVDLSRGFGPKALGITQRTRMDLVIGTLVLNIHGVAPGSLLPVMAGLVPAIHVFADCEEDVDARH